MSHCLITCENLAARLAARLDDTKLVIADCRYDLLAPDAGRRAYQKSHIKGAHYCDLQEDLSAPPTGKNGRHPLPAADALADTFSSIGVNADTTLVVYDDITGIFAARCWWLARWIGLRDVAVLDGGFRRWSALRLPVDDAVPAAVKTNLRADPDAANAADAADAPRVVRMDAVRQAASLIDARQGPRYRGEVEPLDPVKGHIPGARNHCFENNLSDDGRLRPAAELRAQFAALSPQAETIHYCGSGVGACHNILALTAAALPAGRLYPGSWSEWCATPENPVATGAE